MTKPKSAADFLKDLDEDSEYQTRRAADDANSRELSAATASDEADLVSELRALGLNARSVYDFVDEGGAPASATSLLVAHLSQDHHPIIWEGIVRSLSHKSARSEALSTLKRLYVTESDAHRRWTLANALGSMANFSELKDLPGIASYKELFRESRKPPHRAI